MQDFTRHSREELIDIRDEWPLNEDELAAVNAALAALDPGYEGKPENDSLSTCPGVHRLGQGSRLLRGVLLRHRGGRAAE